MILKKYIPKTIVNYVNIIKNNRKYPNRTILTPHIYGEIFLGENISLGRDVYIYEGVSIGDYSYVQNNTTIVSGEIGKFCSISYNNQIGLWEHPQDYISTSPKTYAYNNLFGFDNIWEHSEGPVIGNDVWIGNNVTVMRGVTIGNGAIIGSGAIVTKNIPDYAIAVGVPAKVIKYRFDKETIKALNEIKWWDMNEEELLKLQVFFNMGTKGPEELIKTLLRK